MMTEIRCSNNVQSIAIMKDTQEINAEDNLSDTNILPVIHRLVALACGILAKNFKFPPSQGGLFPLL